MRVGVLAAAIGLLATLAFNPSASAQFVDPALSWKTIETPHFRVTFHPGTEGMAHLTAQAAEEAYDWWTDKLGYQPTAKTNLVIVDYRDGPGGFASLLPNKQIVNFASFAGFASGFANSEATSWEETVTFHEVGHIVDRDYVKGMGANFRQIFGRSIQPGSTEPTLLAEGIPTYGEYKIRGASRANEPRVAMMLRTMVMEDSFPGYQEASFYYDRDEWPGPSSISHDVGPWFVRFLEDKYGTDTYAQIKEAMASNPWWTYGSLMSVLLPGASISGDFNDVLETATGHAMPALWRQFRNWLSGKFDPQIEEIQSEGITPSQRLTDTGFNTDKATWGPNGKWIYYSHSDPDRAGGIRRVHPDGTGDEALVSGSIGDIAVSPSGKSIVYAKLDVHHKFYMRYDLYRYDLATGKEMRLTHGERAFQIAMGPEGEELIYARYNWGQSAPSLHRLDLNSGETQEIRTFDNGTIVEGLALSPNGKTLALSIWKRGGYSDVYTMPASGGELTALTQDKATDYGVTWASEGDYVLFSSDRTGVYNLHAIRLADGTLFRASNVLTGAIGPTVAPDGSQIAFTGYGESGYDVSTMAYAPESWTQVQLSQADIPEWNGFPETDYPVHDYNPWPSLSPKLWFPVLGGSRLGVSTFGADALLQQTYNASAGWDLNAGTPFVDISYSYSGVLPTISLEGSLSGSGYNAGLTVSYPLVRRTTMNQSLSVGYQVSQSRRMSQTISADWSMSHDWALGLAGLSTSASVNAQYNLTVGEAHLAKVVGRASETWQLPVEGDQRLSLRLAGGWSDALLPERGFRIGGPDGSFRVRGFPQGVEAGRVAAAGSLEYDQRLLEIEEGIGLWPVFVDDIHASAFVDAAQVGDQLTPYREDLRVGFGAEARLTLNLFSYQGTLPLTVGVAQGIGQTSPEIYVSFDIGGGGSGLHDQHGSSLRDQARQSTPRSER
ncbi:MAG: hypothetical protein ABEK03_01090 [Candidatus Bipolaricaulia bacterium]